MPQQQKKRPKKRRKKEEKLSFDAGKVFTEPESDVKISENLESDAGRFKAKKGEG